MQQDIISKCNSARDIIYCLAKTHCISIRYNYHFEILQNDVWVISNIENVTRYILNYASNLGLDDLINYYLINNIHLSDLIREAFKYHSSNTITGPYLYFISTNNYPFESIEFTLGISRTTEQSKNMDYIIQCSYPENLLNYIIKLIESKKIGYFTNKFQITKKDIENLCMEINVYPYLRCLRL